MRRWMIVLAILIAVCGLGGCGSAARESDFMVGFSLGAIIEANQQLLLTQESESGGIVSGPALPFFQRREEAVVQIKPSDIPTFMAAIQSDIENALNNSGFKIVGRDGGRQGPGVIPGEIVDFGLSYSDGSVDGMVNVWGVRGQETRLILIVLLTESPKT